MARRYGKAPHELLDMAFADFVFDSRALQLGLDRDAELAKKLAGR